MAPCGCRNECCGFGLVGDADLTGLPRADLQPQKLTVSGAIPGWLEVMAAVADAEALAPKAV